MNKAQNRTYFNTLGNTEITNFIEQANEVVVLAILSLSMKIAQSLCKIEVVAFQMLKKRWLVSEGKGRGMRYRLKQNSLEGSQVGGQVEFEGGQVESQVGDISDRYLDITVSEWHILQSLQEGDKSSKELKTESFRDKALSGAFKERLAGLRKKGMIEYTIPDKPKSSKQKYHLTELGKRMLEDKI